MTERGTPKGTRQWDLGIMICSFLRVAIAGAVMCVALSGAGHPLPVASPPKELAALESGQWVLKDRETGRERRLCLGDRRQLLQLRQVRHQCARFVVTDSERQVSVTNDCGAAGNERTDIRIETPRLFQLQSQGIADGAPFAAAIEGRHVGICR
ncbi:hypothetical protein [Sphingobium sp. SCG-1]|uniref:hypothetical protein n=1 Tax=Sphingobium sp. SCG-1 TaxID=2072936 RepID=UPI001CB9C159|nr:hypothetical protein [Sphingobium sp. SCG-1]